MFALNTLVFCALVLFLLPKIGLTEGLTVGVGIALAMIAPIVVVNVTIKKLWDDSESTALELKAKEEELSDLKTKLTEVTTMDELTGCSNKRHFLDLLIQHSAMSERGVYEFTVAVTQVDQFSNIIDTQGLARGNEVLQLFSRTVKAALREVDVIARLETDKFGLVLSGCGEGDALIIINRISQLISQIRDNDQDDMKITVSGGITCYHGTESPDDLIDHANRALQFAVYWGRDRVAGYNYTDPGTES